MTFGEEKNKRTLSSSLIKDGLSFLGVPVSTSQWATRKVFPWLWPDYYLHPDAQLIHSLYGKSSENWLTIQHGALERLLPTVIMISNSSNTLSLSNILIEFADKTFYLDEEIEAASQHFFKSFKRMLLVRRKVYYPGELARLYSMSREGDYLKLRLQPVRYDAVCKTHMCLDAPLGSKDDTIRQRVHNADGLEPLDNSRLGNALGVNMLLFTADGELILQRRSRRVAVFASSLAPASSGDFEADDFRGSRKTLFDVPLLRESKEEIQIHSDDLEIKTLTFLGLTRELFRGGKPELFLAAQTKLNRNDVSRLRSGAKDKWESSRLIFWPMGPKLFENQLNEDRLYTLRVEKDKLLDNCIEKMSITLLTSIALWWKWRFAGTNQATIVEKI